MAAAWVVGPAAGRVANGQSIIPDPGTYVVDRAGIIDAATEARMESWLRDLDQKTTAQLKVLTIAGLEGGDFFDFAQRQAEAWKLGRAGQDNGALLVLSVNDRKVRFQVGYGLEAVLPDSWCGSLSRTVATQYFKRGAYADGLLEMALATANKIADGSNVSLSGAPSRRYHKPPVGPAGFACTGLMPILLFIIIISAVSRRRRHYRRWGGGGVWEAMFWGSVLNNMLRGASGRSGWGSGGGFGGSFGGGGRFGGGGGGASW